MAYLGLLLNLRIRGQKFMVPAWPKYLLLHCLWKMHFYFYLFS